MERVLPLDRNDLLEKSRDIILCERCGAQAIGIPCTGWVVLVECTNTACRRRSEVAKHDLPTTHHACDTPWNEQWHEYRVVIYPSGEKSFVLMHGYWAVGEYMGNGLFIFDTPFRADVFAAFGIPDPEYAQNGQTHSFFVAAGSATQE